MPEDRRSPSARILPVMVSVLALLVLADPAKGTAFQQTVNSTGTTTSWDDAVWGATAAQASRGNSYLTATGLMATDNTINLGAGGVTGRIRAYAGSNGSPSFTGDQLTIVAGSELLVKDASTAYSANLVLNGGILRFSPNSGASATLSGSIEVAADSVLGSVQSSACTFRIASKISGTRTLRIAAGTGANQTIQFDDGLGDSLNGFAGTLVIGGGGTRVTVDFRQPYVLRNARISMGAFSTSDILSLSANLTVKSFVYGPNSLAPGTYGAAALNALHGNGTQFAGSGTLTVLGENADRDGDGLPDWFEDRIIAFSTADSFDGYADVAGPGDAPRATDFDGDGLSDSSEFAGGTDPTVRDSDLDGYGDAVEVAAGSNPVLATSMPVVARANERSLPAVVEAEDASSFQIYANGVATPIVHDSSDATVVAKAANLLADDLLAVTGTRSTVSTTTSGIVGRAILAGTLGKSPLIDALVSSGKVTVSEIRGNWECYRLVRVRNPVAGISDALVVVGSDRRGTAYGLGAISEAMGVSPWTWWADVPPVRRAAVHLSGLPLDSAPPSVRLRGIFINDEDWGLQEWAEKNYESGTTEVKDIGPKTYGRVFELLLRLRANYCWPAMHPSTRAFDYYAGNKQVADDYAIVMGSSHAEPMLRNNVDEWDRFTSGSGYSNNWNYSQNMPAIYDYWDSRVREVGSFENTYVIGKRGIHDSGMVEGANNAEKAMWLNTIFTDQRRILSNRVDADPSRVPQIFVPYKEVLSIYDTGLVNVPDDVTLVWPDDNHGYIRRLSSSAEQRRRGGAGVYYHLSYWGDPQDYLWLSSTPPSLIREEMTKAYENQCRRLWVFNVGDIKPSEIGMEFAMRLAWNVGAYGPDCQKQWLEKWAAREFGTNASGSVASVMNDYYHLNHFRKPEHMNWKDADSGNSAPPRGYSYPLFSQVHEGDELAERMREFGALSKRANLIYERMPSERKDSFYQLVAYPVRGAENMNLKFLHTERALRAVSQKRKTAAFHSAEATNSYNSILAETAYFNTGMSGGKWNKMMDWRPRSLSVFNLPAQPVDPGAQAIGLGVAVEGRLDPVFTGVMGSIIPDVVLNAVDDASSLIAPMQSVTLDGVRCLWTPGTGASVAAGTGGRATYPFVVSAAGTYSFRFLVRTPNSNDDSWYVQVDGASPATWNDLGIDNPSGWRWVVWNAVTLSAGTHSLTIHQREDGAAMAAIRISNAASMGELGEDDRFAEFRLPELNSITRRSAFVDLINTESSPQAWSASPEHPWVLLSSSSGTVASEQRLNVSIDWNRLPSGETLSSNIRIQHGSASVNVPVRVWNPAIAGGVGFIEENGAVVMEAEHPTAIRSGADAAWIQMSNLGRGDGVMLIEPSSATSRATPAEVIAGSPCLEYSFHLRTTGSHEVEVEFLPALSLNNERGRRYAVSVDAEQPVIVALSDESGSGSTWSRSVLRSSISGRSTHAFTTAGVHTLKIWMVDPGLVLDRLEIHSSPAPYTYHGLRETRVGMLDTLWIAAGETFVVEGSGRKFSRVINEGTLEVRSSDLTVDGDIVNYGTIRIMGDCAVRAGGNVSNFGTLDRMSWHSGVSAGFGNFSNYGSTLETTEFRIQDQWMAEGKFHLRLPSFEGHRYALQINDSLSMGGWQSAGSAQYGAGTIGSPVPLTFSWPVERPRLFFRIALDGEE